MKFLFYIFVTMLSLATFAETFSVRGENAKNFKHALLESGVKGEKRPLGSSALLRVGNVRCKFEAPTVYYSCEIHQKSKVYDSRPTEAKIIFKLLQSKLQVEADKYGSIVVRVKAIDCTTTTGMGPRTECGILY